VKFLKEEMLKLAADMQFEKAEIMKQKIDALQNYQSRSTVVNPRLGNIDVASIVSREGKSYVNYMMVAHGSIIYAKTIEIDNKLDEEDAYVLSYALARLRENFSSTSKEVVVPFEIEVEDQDVSITIPRAGDKKSLLELSLKNIHFFMEDVKKKNTLMLEESAKLQQEEVLLQLQEALQLKDLPRYIECFDNSNFQGAYPVSAMVCFKNGVPSKRDYRHYHIRTVEGINDFASMEEVVYRRYKRLKEEDAPLPQLVIIDGGKGQLSAALESSNKLGLQGRMTIVGLAKREESIFFPGDKDPLQLPYDSPPHQLIRRIRDEVHRFGITFHRETRSKGTFKNELEAIPGIGEKTATDLLKEFRSVKNIKTLTERELTRVVGQAKARIIWEYFNENDGNSDIEKP
jgi:excinuclease ABC subunit C